ENQGLDVAVERRVRRALAIRPAIVQQAVRVEALRGPRETPQGNRVGDGSVDVEAEARSDPGQHHQRLLARTEWPGKEDSPAGRVGRQAVALQVPTQEAQVRVALEHLDTHGAEDVADPEPGVDVPGVGADVVPRDV